MLTNSVHLHLEVCHTQAWRWMPAGGWWPPSLSLLASPRSFPIGPGLGFPRAWWLVPGLDSQEKTRGRWESWRLWPPNLGSLARSLLPPSVAWSSHEVPPGFKGNGNRACLLMRNDKDWRSCCGHFGGKPTYQIWAGSPCAVPCAEELAFNIWWPIDVFILPYPAIRFTSFWLFLPSFCGTEIMSKTWGHGWQLGKGERWKAWTSPQ